MPIGRCQCSKSRSLLVILINIFLFAARVLSHLRSQKEMPHCAFDDVQTVEYRICVFLTDIRLRFALRDDVA